MCDRADRWFRFPMLRKTCNGDVCALDPSRSAQRPFPNRQRCDTPHRAPLVPFPFDGNVCTLFVSRRPSCRSAESFLSKDPSHARADREFWFQSHRKSKCGPPLPLQYRWLDVSPPIDRIRVRVCFYPCRTRRKPSQTALRRQARTIYAKDLSFS